MNENSNVSAPEMTRYVQAHVPKDGERLLCSRPWLRVPRPCGVWSGALHGLGQPFLPRRKKLNTFKPQLRGPSLAEKREGPLFVCLFTVFQGRIIVVPQEESCLCLLVCLKREAQTKTSRERERERLRLISRHSEREL